MDPGEVSLSGPAEARFEDPETEAAVTLRPKDWARVYETTVQEAVSEWRLACRSIGIQYHCIHTNTPFGLALRAVLVQSGGRPR